MFDVRRRKVVALLGGAAAWPLVASAQQAGKVPTIGVLSTATATVWNPFLTAFRQRLRDLGWVEGRTIALEYRFAEGHPERLAEFAAEFVRLNVSVVLTAGSGVPAIKRATSVIPVVFAIAGDPLSGGLVSSLARPGGNATGLSNLGVDLAGKRVELLREVVPGLRRLGILANAAYSDGVVEMEEVDSTARKVGLDVVKLTIKGAGEIMPALETLNGRADALYVVVDGFVAANRTRIIIFGASARLPMIFNTREYVEAGALMSYGPNFPDMFRRSAEYVDKILRGTKPGELPVEQATRFDLVINLSTAKALGMKIPESFLLRADELIE
jgi:ABC-type uncharacterized transport system substrate-binding protein